MKKSLLFMAFLFILGGLCVNAAELTINFNTADLGNTNTTYVEKAFDFTKNGVTFNTNQINPSTGQVRVNKGTTTSASGNFYIYNKTALPNISKVEIQMVSKSAIATDKSNLISIRTADAEITDSSLGTDLSSISGTTLTLVPSATDKSFFRIDLAKIGGTVKFESMTIYYDGVVVLPDPVDYEPNFANVELWEGETAQIDLGSKHPTDIIFISGDESVATVSDEGVITAVCIGETTISVDWGADENFNASSETATFKVNVVEKPEVTGATFDFSVKDPYGLTSTTNSNHYETTATTCVDGIVTCVVGGRYRAWDKSGEYDIRLYKSESGKNNAGTFTISVPKGYQLVTVEFTDGIDGGIVLSSNVGTIENNVWTAGMNDDSVIFTADGTSKVSKIIVSYAVAFPKFEGTEHSFTTESSEIRIADADHAFDIYYRHTPAPAQNNVVAYAEGETPDTFTEVADFDETNREHVIPVNASGTLSYYAVHTTTGAQSETSHIAVTKTATTAIDAIGADAAEGEVEFFDIRGVKVNIDNAAPGLYIRRQGTTATKVIVK